MTDTAISPKSQERLVVTVRADLARHATQALHQLGFRLHAPSHRWYRYVGDRAMADRLFDQLFELGLDPLIGTSAGR